MSSKTSKKAYTLCDVKCSLVAVVRAETGQPLGPKFCTIKDYPTYNNLEKSLSEYLDRIDSKGFSIMYSSEEPTLFKPSQLDPQFPRTALLQKALSQLHYLPPHIDLFTHRGDLVDLALSFMPTEFNGYDKIDHIVFKSHGRLFLFHDRLRDDSFTSSDARNNWYAGQKFEHMCTTTDWPKDVSLWKPLRPQEKKECPIHNILELELSHKMNALVIAENDCRDPSKDGLDSIRELKCTAAQKYKSGEQWHKMSNKQILKKVILANSVMKFMKMCLQVRLCGTTTVVIGFRVRKKLIAIRKFQVEQLENHIYYCLKSDARSYYSRTLKNLNKLIERLDRACADGSFYKLTKSGYKEPILVNKISADDAVFKVPFIADFEKLLSQKVKERCSFLESHREQENFGKELKEDYKGTATSDDQKHEGAVVCSNSRKKNKNRKKTKSKRKDIGNGKPKDVCEGQKPVPAIDKRMSKNKSSEKNTLQASSDEPEKGLKLGEIGQENSSISSSVESKSKLKVDEHKKRKDKAIISAKIEEKLSNSSSSSLNVKGMSAISNPKGEGTNAHGELGSNPLLTPPSTP